MNPTGKLRLKCTPCWSRSSTEIGAAGIDCIPQVKKPIASLRDAVAVDPDRFLPRPQFGVLSAAHAPPVHSRPSGGTLKPFPNPPHPTLTRLRELRFFGMARAFGELHTNPSAAALGHADWLAVLLEDEAAERNERALQIRLRAARLPHRAEIEDLDYRATRGLDRAAVEELTAWRWLDQGRNLIIEGATGTGKTWLACALGRKACQDKRSVLLQRVPRMFDDLDLARANGHYARLVDKLGKVELLILDDWGIKPLDPRERQDIIEIFESRWGRGGTVIISQAAVERWPDIIGDNMLTPMILDRFVPYARRVVLKGGSLRAAAASTAAAD